MRTAPALLLAIAAWLSLGNPALAQVRCEPPPCPPGYQERIHRENLEQAKRDQEYRARRGPVQPQEPSAPPTTSLDPKKAEQRRLFERPVGYSGTLTDDVFIACKSLDIYLRFIQLGLVEKDLQAAATLARRNKCQGFTKGDYVTISEKAPFLHCLREKGNTDCYWTAGDWPF